MGAPTENEFWKLRKDMTEDGRKLSVAQVVEKAQEYIDFCIENPLKEEVVVSKGINVNKGVNEWVTEYSTPLKKMRAMTLKGLYHWLDVDATTWAEWREDKKYSHIISRIENLIYTYKFEGAAAGLLDSRIISRDLGLVEKREDPGIKEMIKTVISFGGKDVEI